MGRVAKSLRRTLIEKMQTRQEVQHAINTFNSTIGKSMVKLDDEIIEIQKSLNKLER